MKGSSRVLQVCSICIMGLLCLLGMQSQAQAQQKVGVLYIVHGGFDNYSERNLFDASAQLFAVRPDHIVHQTFLWNKGEWQGILQAGNAPKEIVKYAFNYGRLGGTDPFHTLTDTQIGQLEAELSAQACADTTFVVDYASWMAGDRPENYPYPRFLYNPPPWIVPGDTLSEENISELNYCGEQEKFGTSLDFKNGSAAFTAGAILTGSSGATARIEKVEVSAGSWAGGDAEGRLYLKDMTYQAGTCSRSGIACISTIPCGGFLESCLGDYFDNNDSITDGAGGVALSAGNNRWPDCDPYRFDVDGPAERFIAAGVDRIVMIDMTTGAVRFFKTGDVISLFKRALADNGGSDIPVVWLNDPNNLMDASYPSAPVGVTGLWNSDLSYSSNTITDVSVPLAGNPNPVIEDMDLSELLVEGIESSMVVGAEATTGIMLLNHATRDWDQYWDPKIDDTLVINNNIKNLLLDRYPDMDPTNIVGAWMGVMESGTAEGGPAGKERTRNMRGENLGHAWLYEQPNGTLPGGEWGYLYWNALEYLKNKGVTHIVVGFPQIVTDSVLNLVEVHNQIGKELGIKNWLYWDTPDYDTYPGIGHPFADYWGNWATTDCGEWKLNYNTGTQAFVVNRTITGQTSGATGLIFAKTGTTATGTLTLKKVSGAFISGESIIGSGTNGGIAKANGTQSLTVKPDCCFTMGGCGDPLRPYPPPRQVSSTKARGELDPSLAYDLSDYGHLGYDETGASGPVDPNGPVQDQYTGTWAMYSPPSDDPRLAALLAKHVLMAVDCPPTIEAGPYLAAGNWSVLPTSQESPMYLDANYNVMWTFSDDYASCPGGECTHAAEYQAVGGSSWSSLDVTANAAKGFAYVTLPVESLQNATTYAFRFTVTDCASQTTESQTYYFRVAVTDAPPVITSAPFVTAGAWPALTTMASNAVVLDQNSSVLWKFSDDYASCSGLCTHRARYRLVGDTAWTWITVSADPTGKKYAYTELPVEGLAAGTYHFYFDVRDCAGQVTKASKVYYFKVDVVN